VDEVIKIGAVVATRGPVALLGNSFVKAIHLANEELKNTRHQYELVIEEIPSPDRAEPAIEKLIKIGKVNAMIVGLSYFRADRQDSRNRSQNPPLLHLLR
jgi:hypothetical protein